MASIVALRSALRSSEHRCHTALRTARCVVLQEIVANLVGLAAVRAASGLAASRSATRRSRARQPRPGRARDRRRGTLSISPLNRFSAPPPPPMRSGCGRAAARLFRSSTVMSNGHSSPSTYSFTPFGRACAVEGHGDVVPLVQRHGPLRLDPDGLVEPLVDSCRIRACRPSGSAHGPSAPISSKAFVTIAPVGCRRVDPGRERIGILVVAAQGEALQVRTLDEALPSKLAARRSCRTRSGPGRSARSPLPPACRLVVMATGAASEPSSG